MLDQKTLGSQLIRKPPQHEPPHTHTHYAQLQARTLSLRDQGGGASPVAANLQSIFAPTWVSANRNTLRDMDVILNVLGALTHRKDTPVKLTFMVSSI